MKKSPYDRERFFEKYSQMDRSRLGLAGAGEWESLEPLLPDFAGKRVLDLGCGYGWHCIYAAEHGAAAVTGVDLSEKMLAVAREKTTAPQVTYIRGDMAETPFPPESFDVVLSSLAIHYLPSFTDFLERCGSACHPAATLSSLWSTPFSLLPVPRSGTTARTAPPSTSLWTGISRRDGAPPAFWGRM